MLCIEEGQDHEDVEEAQLPYRHVQSLGHGHSGNVEEVRDQHTNKTYARKTIPIPYSKAKRVERTRVFQNEVKIIRGLGKHRHIVSVFATYVTKRHFGIVLEPVASGGDLERFLAEYWNDIDEPNGSDSSAQRTATMAAVLEQGFGCLAAGLAFMHANKIRHKDIKPHNILVHEGRMIYTDFGYSFNSTGFSRSTTVGTPSFFTRRYSAPEVLEHENRNSRSDIFSLGCVFFDMLSTLTRTLHHEEIEEFAFIIETMHVHIAAMQVPASVSTVPPAVIAMTASEASKRPCAAHLTIAILESPGSCCLGCKTTCKDKWIMSAPEDDCHGLSIMKGRCDRAQEATEQEFVHATPTPSYHNAKDDTSSQDQIKDLSEAKRISSIVNQWTWSEEYQNHYFTTIDHSGRLSIVCSHLKHLTDIIGAYAYTWADQPSRSAGSQQANTTTQDGQSSHSE
jgi:serine/threonine protein kinase